MGHFVWGMLDTGHACDYTNIILYCIFTYDVSLLWDELSADSVPNEVIRMTCISRRLDER